MQACFRHLLRFFLAALLVFTGIFSNPLTVKAAEAYVPTATYNGAPVPDWGNISFSSLPALQDGGSINIPADAVNQLGYNPSRSWQSGTSLGDVMMLGDVQDDFGFQGFSLNGIAQLSGFDLNTISLSNFPLVRRQTIASLTRTIPGLGNLSLGQVKPLADLVNGNLTQAALKNLNLNDWGGQVLSAPISAIANNPVLGSLSLDKLPLDQYSFAQIPGLNQVQLGNFQDWQTAFINGVPGLSQVAFSQFPLSPGQFLGFVAIHDVTYGGDSSHKESRQTPTKFSITGSDKVGFKYPCAQSQGCDYIELKSPLSLGSVGSPELNNARWIRGGKGSGEQMVRGGEGILGQLNGGKEPTGRHPFGPAFKVVLTKTDESSATGQFSLYFRVCHQGAIDLGCTPYFIGPVPFLPTKEKGMVFVGLTPMTPPAGIESPETPQEVQDLIDQYDSGSSSDSSEICQVDPSKLDAVSRAALTALPGGEMQKAAKYMPHIMQECAKAGVTDKNQLAYILATAEHESDHFNTTNEYSRAMYDSCGWGEGLIQVTWCENKQKVFQKLGLPGYKGMSDKRLHQPQIAAAALCRGMKEGWYTNRSIGQCISGSKADLACARGVVNGDYGKVGGIINEKYGRFERALRSANGTSAAGKDLSGAVVCSSPSGSTGGSAGGGAKNNRIMQSAQKLRGMNTSMGPKGGREACAWAVNKVLADAGAAPIGSNPNYVPSVAAAMKSGRGIRVAPSQAKAGDIILARGYEHIGICQNDGCTRVLSNSSSRATFSWQSDRTFGGSYNNSAHLGEAPTEEIYRVK
jgi:hypothetical protein